MAHARSQHPNAPLTPEGRRTAERLTKRKIIRCLKRYIAREVVKALPRAAQTQPLTNAA